MFIKSDCESLALDDFRGLIEIRDKFKILIENSDQILTSLQSICCYVPFVIMKAV